MVIFKAQILWNDQDVLVEILVMEMLDSKPPVGRASLKQNTKKHIENSDLSESYFGTLSTFWYSILIMPWSWSHDVC